MVFAGINYISIVVAAIAGFAFGALYYMTLAKPWMAAVGLTKAKIQKNGQLMIYFIAILANLIMAWVLAGVLGHLGPGQVTIRNGIIAAAFIWFGFVITTMTVNNGFGMRKPILTVIDAGHWLGVLLIMGGIIGALGV